MQVLDEVAEGAESLAKVPVGGERPVLEKAIGRLANIGPLAGKVAVPALNAAGLAAFGPVFMPSDVGLVDLDAPAESLSIGADHRDAEAVQHHPCDVLAAKSKRPAEDRVRSCPSSGW